MHKPRPNDPQRRDDVLLITRYCDGQLSAVQFDELNDRLAVDPAFRRLFIELAIQAEHLETVVTRPEAVFDEFAYIPPVAQAQKVSARSVAKTSGYLFREAVHSRAIRKSFFALAAVVVLAVALTLTILFSSGDKPNPTGSAEERPAPVAPAVAVATLTAEYDARWAHAAPQLGQGLHPGQRLVLTEGVAEVTTARGAVVVLDAPCTIKLTDNDNMLELVNGKLVGLVETERAHGFRVDTPTARIVDFGTEFGVAVSDAGHSTVHVFQGEVHASAWLGDGRLGESVILRQDQAAYIESGTKSVVRVASAHHTFAARRGIAAGPGVSPYQRWLAYSDNLRRDADVVLYYTFGNAEVSGQTLRNRAGGQGARQYDATFTADAASPGRFDEKPAFGFNDDGDFVEATMDREMPAATLAGWYWIDEMDGTFASLLHTSGTGNRGGVHWHVNTNHGTGWAIEFVQNRTRNPQPGYWHDLLSTDWQPQSLTGRWVHLALCYDSTAGDAVLYVDGREAQRSQIDDGVPIKLGRFRLGNWDAPEREGTSDWPRPLRGRVDEFVVIERALSGAEVAAMYDAGRPDN